MSETKWTPGPYRTHGDRYIEAGDNHIIASVEPRGPGAFEEQRALQRLLAAAPDLYASLAELVERRERACREQGGPVDGSDGRYARARAALARARGDQR